MEDTVSLSALTADDFEPLVGTSFILQDGNGAEVPLTLDSMRRTNGNIARVTRQPFALLFKGPPGRVLPQHIYLVRHPQMGALEIFIVPVGASPEYVEYEAVFG
jgi:hypothetical protein